MTWVQVTAAIVLAAIGTFVSFAQNVISNWFPKPDKVRPWHLYVAGAALLVTAVVLAAISAIAPSQARQASGPVSQYSQAPPPIAATPPTSPSPEPPATPNGGQHAIVVDRDDYRMVPSSTPDTNDKDKVDLDTGEPGHGGTPLLVGPPRQGGPAEIILEDDEIHSIGNERRMVRLSSHENSGYRACRSTLKSTDRRVGRIAYEELHQNDHICVETDEGRIALVKITDRSTSAIELIISFTTWEQ